MRELSAALITAQKAAASEPYVSLRASSKAAGVVRLDWDRLYTGEENNYLHGMAIAGDGSMTRACITPPADSGMLYYQRVTAPGTESDFSQWTYSGQYSAVAVAAAACGAEVSIFWAKDNREIRRMKSADYGATWGSAELVDYSNSQAVSGLAAAYASGGDLALFFADIDTLYVKEHAGGSWQPKSAWDKTTGNLSGVGCVYDGDWQLILTGQDSSGNYKVWSLACGDGGEVEDGAWSELHEVASAPSGGDYEYGHPSLDKPDVFRCRYMEKFGGTTAYNRPFGSHALPGTAYTEGMWLEPVPFNASPACGLAMAHGG